MLSRVIFLFIMLDIMNAIDIYDYDEQNAKASIVRGPVNYNDDPVPNILTTAHVTPYNFIEKEVTRYLSIDPPVNYVPIEEMCENFTQYALNCTVTAAKIYNSMRKAPPLPSHIDEWCKAIKHLTDCAVQWNVECRDISNSHFNKDSISGHRHVVNSICDDEIYLTKYNDLPECIESVGESWETCYTRFKQTVDYHKNTTKEWTHFEPHFFLCCARAHFRRCTLDAIFNKKYNCSEEQALTLQKFSVIVSEGDVYQDCTMNMVYTNCPDGDPRPGALMSQTAMNHAMKSQINAFGIVLFLAVFTLWAVLWY